MHPGSLSGLAQLHGRCAVGSCSRPGGILPFSVGVATFAVELAVAVILAPGAGGSEGAAVVALDRAGEDGFPGFREFDGQRLFYGVTHGDLA